MIPVTQPYLPPRKALDRYIDGVYERRWLTNNGPLVRELESRLADYLGVDNLVLVANGTLALQVAFRLLGVQGEAITTPFTFAATSSAMRWQGIQPRYADIDSQDFNLDPELARARITPDTSAIVPVHVYGNPCRTQAFHDIGKQHGLPIIYDAAHAFGVESPDGASILNAGDISTLSFHATKLFHTVEGGALIIRDPELYEQARRLINFGFDSDSDIVDIGINAKMSEMNAAMGLATLDCVDDIIAKRAALVEGYRKILDGHVGFQQRRGSENGAYMPILLDSSEQTAIALQALYDAGVHARRYFAPALHETPIFNSDDTCPVASDVVRRVLCLPLYQELTIAEVRIICDTLIDVLKG